MCFSRNFQKVFYSHPYNTYAPFQFDEIHSKPVYKEFKWCIGPQATLVILEIQVINVADAADVYLCGGGVGR